MLGGGGRATAAGRGLVATAPPPYLACGGQAWEDDCRDLHSDLQRAIADFKAQEARLRAAAGGPRAALDGGPAAGLPPGWHPDDASPSDLVFPCPFPPAAPAEPPHPLEFYPTSRLDLDWGVVEEGGAPAPGVACGPRSREPGTQLFVLLFGVGQADTEGIYSLRSMPKDDGLPLDTIVAFECDDDAQRYACLLEATMDHEPTVWPIEWGDLLEFCNSAGYRLRLEPGGSLLIPPDYNVGMTDWEKSLRLRKGEFAVLDSEPAVQGWLGGGGAEAAAAAAAASATAAGAAAPRDLLLEGIDWPPLGPMSSIWGPEASMAEEEETLNVVDAQLADPAQLALVKQQLERLLRD
eukprot:scaffold6.g2858.t1